MKNIYNALHYERFWHRCTILVYNVQTYTAVCKITLRWVNALKVSYTYLFFLSFGHASRTAFQSLQCGLAWWIEVFVYISIVCISNVALITKMDGFDRKYQLPRNYRNSLGSTDALFRSQGSQWGLPPDIGNRYHSDPLGKDILKKTVCSRSNSHITVTNFWVF